MRPVLCALLLAAAFPCLSQTTSVNSVDYQGTAVPSAPVVAPDDTAQGGLVSPSASQGQVSAPSRRLLRGAGKLRDAGKLASPVPRQDQGPAWMYVSSTGLPYDTAAVLDKREEYYSSKNKAVIFSIIGTGLGVIGNVLVQTACEEEYVSTGYGRSYGRVCDDGQLLAGVGLVAGAIPFQVIGLVNIIKASVQGGQLKGLENRAGIRDISVDAGWNPQTKTTGMMASVRF